MKYRKVQNYQLVTTWEYKTSIALDRIIHTEYIDLVKGLLVMKKGFCFSPSGPAIATKNIMRAVCAHDAGYWLIRNGHLETYWKEPFDDLLHELCLKDGMSRIRAKWIYKTVVTFGDASVDPANRQKVKTAP